MTANLTDPIFTDEAAAREHLEKTRWPNGPYCPHCGNSDPERITKLEGKSHRPGLYQCNECLGHFTVTVGSVMERSHIPLHKWVLGFHLMAASKKGVSAHQLHRMLGVTYKTAWFMAHRIRTAMTDANPGPLGGEGKVVEADETYTGNKAGNKARRNNGWRAGGEQWKVLSLVERGGKARSTHVYSLTANAVRKVLVTNVDRRTDLMTDQAKAYTVAGKEFASHATVNHSLNEWARGLAHTNTIEGFFSIFKRGMKGVYQHCGEAHLHRYLAEFDFRYSHRVKLGYSDGDRATIAIKGAEGKRLTYRQPRSQVEAFQAVDAAIPF